VSINCNHHRIILVCPLCFSLRRICLLRSSSCHPCVFSICFTFQFPLSSSYSFILVVIVSSSYIFHLYSSLTSTPYRCFPPSGSALFLLSFPPLHFPSSAIRSFSTIFVLFSLVKVSSRATMLCGDICSSPRRGLVVAVIRLEEPNAAKLIQTNIIIRGVEHKYLIALLLIRCTLFCSF
jgi:hypothetical protein